MQFPDAVSYDPLKKRTLLHSVHVTDSVPGKPLEYFHSMVLGYGSSVEGRMESYREITRTVQKPAVLISENLPYMYFPLFSPYREDCIWLNYGNLFQTHRLDDSTSCISFFDGYKMTVDVNIRIITKQIKRCKQYMEYIHTYSMHTMQSFSLEQTIQEMKQGKF